MYSADRAERARGGVWRLLDMAKTQEMGRVRALSIGCGLLGLVGVLTLTACGSNVIASWTRSHPHEAGSRGSIHGFVMRKPGSDPRSGSDTATAKVPVSGDPIVARNKARSKVARAISARDGSFRMSLPKGVYTVTEGICGVRKRVEVKSGATRRLTLTIPNSC
jgi:hypothetical protein